MADDATALVARLRDCAVRLRRNNGGYGAPECEEAAAALEAQQAVIVAAAARALTRAAETVGALAQERWAIYGRSHMSSDEFIATGLEQSEQA